MWGRLAQHRCGLTLTPRFFCHLARKNPQGGRDCERSHHAPHLQTAAPAAAQGLSGRRSAWAAFSVCARATLARPNCPRRKRPNALSHSTQSRARAPPVPRPFAAPTQPWTDSTRPYFAGIPGRFRCVRGRGGGQDAPILCGTTNHRPPSAAVLSRAGATGLPSSPHADTFQPPRESSRTYRPSCGRPGMVDSRMR